MRYAPRETARFMMAATNKMLSKSLQDVASRLQSFELRLEVDGGVLTILPLNSGWLTQTAELLTSAFVDTDAASLGLYRS